MLMIRHLHQTKVNLLNLVLNSLCLNETLNVTLALFDSTQKNIIVADVEHPGNKLAIGEASSQGVELDISGTLPADIDIWFSYAYTQAEVEEDYKDTGIGVNIKAR